MNRLTQRIEALEAVAFPICTECFTAEGDGLDPCTRPDIQSHPRRCGRTAYGNLDDLPESTVEQLVTARAGCYAMTRQEYLDHVAEARERGEVCTDCLRAGDAFGPCVRQPLQRLIGVCAAWTPVKEWDAEGYEKIQAIIAQVNGMTVKEFIQRGQEGKL